MVRGTRHQKIIIDKLITNEQGNIFAMVNKSHSAWQRGETEDLMKTEAILDHSTSFHMSLNTSMYGSLTASI